MCPHSEGELEIEQPCGIIDRDQSFGTLGNFKSWTWFSLPCSRHLPGAWQNHLCKEISPL